MVSQCHYIYLCGRQVDGRKSSFCQDESSTSFLSHHELFVELCNNKASKLFHSNHSQDRQLASCAKMASAAILFSNMPDHLYARSKSKMLDTCSHIGGEVGKDLLTDAKVLVNHNNGVK